MRKEHKKTVAKIKSHVTALSEAPVALGELKDIYQKRLDAVEDKKSDDAKALAAQVKSLDSAIKVTGKFGADAVHAALDAVVAEEG